MGIFSGLSSLVDVRADAGRAPWDDYWYGPVGGPSVAGVNVTADTAMKTSAVYRCVTLISQTIASLSLITYEDLPDETRQRARGYYLYDVLRYQPNRWQTAFEWKQMMESHRLMRGNAYSQIVPGRRGFADQLIPLHPDRVSVEQYRNGAWHQDGIMDGNPIRYKVRRNDGTTDILQKAEVFHLKGPSNGGLTGMGVIEFARDSIGLALATESYGARLFSQDARPGGIIKHPGKLSKDAKDNIQNNWVLKYSGLGNKHKPAVFDEGMEWQTITMNNEDSQFLETREYGVADICRFFGVPLHLAQLNTKTTSWGSGVEAMSQEFKDFTIVPLGTSWSETISRDLITSTDRYYAEFLYESFFRADAKTRSEVYQTAAGGNAPYMTRNEIRRAENLNPIEGLDEMLAPKNMRGINDPLPVAQPAPAREPAPQPKRNAHYDVLLRETAGRIVRKEITALSKAARRCAGDNDMWAQAVEEFYSDHAEFVGGALGVSGDKAEAYVSRQCALMIQGGAMSLQNWEGMESIETLLNLVKGEYANAV